MDEKEVIKMDEKEDMSGLKAYEQEDEWKNRSRMERRRKTKQIKTR